MAVMRLAAILPASLLLVLAGCAGGNAAPTGFAITSSAFADNAAIPAEYSCTGRNVPPPLRWQHVPAGAASLALVVDDPDAPGGRYVHWVVSGIPVTSTGISAGVLPEAAVVSLNSAAEPRYFGPCPPPGAGAHHYRFELYALSKPLALTAATPASESTAAIGKASIAVARTVGLFER